jgi:hypothetical protein
MRQYHTWCIRILVTLLLLSGGRAFAQFSSGIEGIVHDTTGAVVAGAKVTITDTSFGSLKDCPHRSKRLLPH